MNDLNGVDVSRETLNRLQAFADLTVKWTARINLISKSTVHDVWTRHVVDSAQLYPLAPKFEKWVDVGSGGGFPGIVIAIIAQEKNPDAEFTLIESDARKATFLRTATRELGLAANIETARAETVRPQKADVMSARALASLADLLPFAERHLSATGIGLFPKGRRYKDEISAVAADCIYEFTEHPSITDPQSRILKVKRIPRAA